MGSIEYHKDPQKKYVPDKHIMGQTWFPVDWNEDKILQAGTYVMNHYTTKTTENGCTIYKGIYENVRITVINNKPGTIFPDSNQKL